MARILTIDPDQTKGLRKRMVRMIRRQNGGIVPGIYQILIERLPSHFRTGWLYSYLAWPAMLLL